MKKIATILSVAVIIFVAGCTSFTTAVYNSEKLTTDSASAATSAFNAYYEGSTNKDSLEDAKTKIYAADRTLSQTLATVDKLRIACTANPAATNETALQLVLTAAQTQSTNIVSLVQTVLNATK